MGGYALAVHGAPRHTGDIDIFVKLSSENTNRVLRALDDFGFGSLELTEDDFSSPDKVVQLGVVPVRVDIITSITAVSWEDAIAGCVEGKYGDVPAKYLGGNEFIQNKRAMGRKKDLADLEAYGTGQTKRAHPTMQKKQLWLAMKIFGICTPGVVQPISIQTNKDGSSLSEK